MVWKRDLVDYQIDFDRMSNDYLKHYNSVRHNIVAIRRLLSLLLNDYFLTPLSMNRLVLDVEFEFCMIKVNMLEEDYIQFTQDIFSLLEELLNSFETQEMFEQCQNISDFIYKFYSLVRTSFPKKDVDSNQKDLFDND